MSEVTWKKDIRLFGVSLEGMVVEDSLIKVMRDYLKMLGISRISLTMRPIWRTFPRCLIICVQS